MAELVLRHGTERDLVALTDLYNHYVGVFEQVGYKFGRYWDVQWWQRAMRSGGREAPQR